MQTNTVKALLRSAALALLILLIYALPLQIHTYLHEEVHERIGTYHGCVNSEVDKTLPDARYVCHEYSQWRNESWALQEWKLQSEHESKAATEVMISLLLSTAATVMITKKVV